MSDDKWWPSRYGPEDQIGTLNEIGTPQVQAAAGLVRSGRIYDLGRILDENVPAFPGRTFRQTLVDSAHAVNRRTTKGGRRGLGRNEVNWITELVYGTFQLGTQLCGLNHLQIGTRSYNGNALEDIAEEWGTNRLGMETVPQIVTRGVLLDIAGLRGVEQLARGDVITPDDVQAALRKEDVEIQRGDAVLFHTGWGALWGEDSAAYLAGEPGPGMGAARWLVERAVALTGCDTWSFGPVPSEDPEEPFVVPQTLNAKHGMFVMENLDTARLAADRVYEFMFVLTHPLVRGATGAWVSPVAVV